MSAILEFDPETSRRVEALYTTPDVIQQRRVVREVLELRAGERVLDVGVGPGFLAAEMAAEVGPAGKVCGIDPSASMLAIAQTRATQPGSAPVELKPGDANHLPYPDASFDVATATQVLEYVEDIPGALEASSVRVITSVGVRMSASSGRRSRSAFISARRLAI
jgi:arsenite methyltransferase